jgi:hypothetical protein
MANCAKRGCKAHALRGGKYCLFHTKSYTKKPTSRRSKSKTTTRRRPSRRVSPAKKKRSYRR